MELFPWAQPPPHVMPAEGTGQLTKEEAGDLIKRRRVALGLTQDQLVERTGLSSQSYLSSFEKGRYHVGRSEHFPAIARELGLTFEEVRSINPGALITLVHSGEVFDPRTGLKQAQDGAVILADDGEVDVPVFGLATANPDGNMPGVQPLGTIRVPPNQVRNTGRAYLVLGDSMDDGGPDAIRDGDAVMCDHGDLDLKDRKIYIVRVAGNGILLKRVREYADGFMELVSDNTRYRPIRPDEAQVIGRVYYHKPAGRPL